MKDAPNAGQRFDEVESDLRRDWENTKGNSKLGWDKASQACRAAWDRADQFTSMSSQTDRQQRTTMDKNNQAARDRPATQKTGNRDPKTESRTQRPEDVRTAGRARGEGSDDHRSGSKSGRH